MVDFRGLMGSYFVCRYGWLRVAGFTFQVAVVIFFNVLVLRNVLWPISAYFAVPMSIGFLWVILDSVIRFLREPRAVIAHQDTLEIQWRRGSSLTVNVDEIEIISVDRQAFHHLFDHIVIRAGKSEFRVFGDARNYKDLLHWLGSSSKQR